MGLGPESPESLIKLKNWEVNNNNNNSNSNISKSRKVNKNKKKDGAADGEEIGCWVKFRLLENCMPSRSKVDNSMSTGTSTNYVTLAYSRIQTSKSTHDLI
ncbi:hypothetical protein QYF36_012798 [Acer negundo]|nr:hypothetical protein QYF36_012798 [Acer negundo]